MLPYFAAVRFTSGAPSAFAEAVKLTKFTELWDTDLTWSFLNATNWIIRVMTVTMYTVLWDAVPSWYSPRAIRREDDELHWTVRSPADLIFSECYSVDLSRSWRWQNTLDYEIPSSLDTLRVLFIRFDDVRVTKHTGLWDADLAWYNLNATLSICWGREDEEQH